MPKPANNSFQNMGVNIASLSDTIFFGTPCNLTTSQMNTFATFLSEKVDFIRMKCATFVNLSKKTRMESCCPTILEKLVIKSMEITSHFQF